MMHKINLRGYVFLQAVYCSLIVEKAPFFFCCLEEAGPENVLVEQITGL